MDYVIATSKFINFFCTTDLFLNKVRQLSITWDQVRICIVLSYHASLTQQNGHHIHGVSYFNSNIYIIAYKDVMQEERISSWEVSYKALLISWSKGRQRVYTHTTL